MKTFSEYIAEARELVGKLPFRLSEYKYYLSCVLGATDDDDYIKEFEALVEKVWGKRLAKALRGWSEGAAETMEPAQAYKVLKGIPKERLERVLGAGSYGTAIGVGKDKVIKWFHAGAYMDNDIKFYKFCMKTPLSVFPKIYKVTDKYVIMERLEVGTRKCKLYDKIANTNWKDKYDISTKAFNVYPLRLAEYIVTGRTTSDYSDIDIDELRSHLSNADSEFLDWALVVYNGYWSGDFYLEDFKLANIGERKSDKSVVWFDI